MEHYVYEDDVRIPVEFLGMGGVLGPTPNMCASTRLNMSLSTYRQWNVLCNPEAPALSTGYDQKIIEYTTNKVVSENEVKIIATIPKYKPQMGFGTIDDNPENTIIYKDLETHQIGYTTVRKTESICCDFGWENIPRSGHNNPGHIIPANTKLVDSPATTDDVYKPGINVRIAPISLGSTIEDAYPISESFAKKLTKLKTQKITIMVKANQMPLNLFGDIEEYAIIPKIGDKVRPDGVVAAFRSFDQKSLISDLLPEKLTEINEVTDRKYVSRLPGGEIYDINVFVGNKHVLNAGPYRSLKEYYDKHMEYYAKIVEIYEQYKESELTKEFSTLVTEAMGKTLANGGRIHGISPNMAKNVKMVIRNEVPYIIVEIMIKKKVPLTVGDKISSRHGHKGICCEVVPDELMPMDDYGFRADMCTCPMSIPKRTNPGFAHEIEILRTAEWIVKFMDEKFETDEEKFRECMDLHKMIYPTVGADVEATVRQEGKIAEYLQHCREQQVIPIIGPPAPKMINKDLPNKLRERFGMKTSPVSIGGHDRDGNIVKKRTRSDVIIGKCYVYFINKSAVPASSGFGYVNKLNQPVSNEYDRDISVVRLAPYRFGEDDLRMLTAAGVQRIFNRLRNLQGNSAAGVDHMVTEQLRSPNPMRIKSFDIDDDKLYDNNQSLAAYFNYGGAAGLDIRNTLMEQKEALGRIHHINSVMQTAPPKIKRRPRRKKN